MSCGFARSPLTYHRLAALDIHFHAVWRRWSQKHGFLWWLSERSFNQWSISLNPWAVPGRLFNRQRVRGKTEERWPCCKKLKMSVGLTGTLSQDLVLEGEARGCSPLMPWRLELRVRSPVSHPDRRAMRPATTAYQTYWLCAQLLSSGNCQTSNIVIVIHRINCSSKAITCIMQNLKQLVLVHLSQIKTRYFILTSTNVDQLWTDFADWLPFHPLCMVHIQQKQYYNSEFLQYMKHLKRRNCRFDLTTNLGTWLSMLMSARENDMAN